MDQQEAGAVMAWTAQVTLVAGLLVAVAGAGHVLGRVRGRRARLRRLLRRPAVPAIIVGLVGAGVVLFALTPRSDDRPRRTADYLPGVGGHGGLDPALVAVPAAILVGGGLVLTAVWIWLRFGRPPARRASTLRHLVPVVAAALIVAGLAFGWLADRITPVAFGWYMYASLATGPVAAPSTDRVRALDATAGTFTVLGLAVLTMVAGYRSGRHETHTDAEP